jgi:hypothetical protein
VKEMANKTKGISHEMGKKIIDRIFPEIIKIPGGFEMSSPKNYSKCAHYQLRDREGTPSDVILIESELNCSCGCEMERYEQRIGFVSKRGPFLIGRRLLEHSRGQGKRNEYGEFSPDGKFEREEKLWVNPRFLELVPGSIDELLKINFGL